MAVLSAGMLHLFIMILPPDINYWLHTIISVIATYLIRKADLTHFADDQFSCFAIFLYFHYSITHRGNIPVPVQAKL